VLKSVVLFSNGSEDEILPHKPYSSFVILMPCHVAAQGDSTVGIGKGRCAGGKPETDEFGSRNC
jgi:hypothetical protein